jgi:hypothetical protein
LSFGGAVAQLGARLDGIEEVVGSNPIGSTNTLRYILFTIFRMRVRRWPANPAVSGNHTEQREGFAPPCFEVRGKVWRHDHSSKMAGQWQS